MTNGTFQVISRNDTRPRTFGGEREGKVMSTFYDGSGTRYSILEGEHEADIGEIGVAYCENVARKFSAVDDLLSAAKLAKGELLMMNVGGWSPALNALFMAIAKAEGHS